MYKIEKGIPISGKSQSELRKTMESMEIGDSFFMGTIQEQNKARGVYLRGIKFSIRKENTGFRCWRIK